MGVNVAGCSIDSLEAQRAFADKLGGLRFPLIADEDGSIAKAYGVMHDRWPLAGRRSVVIGEDSIVLRTYPEASAKGHAEQVLNDLRVVMGE